MSDPALDVTAYERDVIEHGLFGAARSRMLSDLTAGKPWQAALDKGSATFGGKAYRAQILGTHAAGDGTFLWAWANPGAGGWGPAMTAAQTLRALGDKPGYAVFRERKVAAKWVPFQELAWVSGELAGAHGVHFANAGGGTTVALLLTDAPVKMSEFSLAYLPGVLLAFQPETLAPIRPCVARFLERLGFTVQPSGKALEGQRAEGLRVKIHFDDQGRLGKFEMNLVPVK